MFKILRKPISMLLSLGLIAGAASGLAITSNAEEKYFPVSTWSAPAFNDMEGNGLTTDAAGLYKVNTQLASIGTFGYGIWAYLSPSEGNVITTESGHTYRFDCQLMIDGYAETEETDLFNGDVWIYAPVDKTITTDPITAEMYDAVETVEYDETYGYAYKTVSTSLTVPDDVTSGTGEFRFYTNGIANFRLYKIFVYDVTAGGTTPCVYMDTGTHTPYNVYNKIIDTEHYIECENIEIPKGLYVSRATASKNSFDDKLVVGGMKNTLNPGSYRVTADIDATDISAGKFYTFNVLDADGTTVATKSVGSADQIDGKCVIDFTVDKAGDYSIEYRVSSGASLILTSVELSRKFDSSDKIDRLNQIVQSIPEINEENLSQCRTLVDEGLAIIDGLKADYGDTVTGSIENFTEFVSKVSSVENLEEYCEARKADSEAVDELIGAVTSKDDAENIAIVDEAIEQFVTTYGTGSEKYISKYAAYKAMLNGAFGDLNGDGDVNSADALIVLQITVNKVQADETMKTLGDVDKSGAVDSADALAILQKTVGKLDKFKVEE